MHNQPLKPLRFARSARKHRVGRARVSYVVDHAAPVAVPARDGRDARLFWSGADDRGLELEVVALDLPDEVLIIHVMPTALRRST